MRSVALDPYPILTTTFAGFLLTVRMTCTGCAAVPGSSLHLPRDSRARAPSGGLNVTQ